MKLCLLAFVCASLHLPLSLPSPFLCSQEKGEGELAVAGPVATPGQIRVMAVKSTPEPETAILVVQVPKMRETISGNPVWIQSRIDGYTLSSDSQFDRADEISNSKMGQTLRIVIDDKPWFPATESSIIDPFNEQGWYYDQVSKIEIPFKLKSGFHTIRAFLARSFGESLKGEKVFFASYFFVGKVEDESLSSILTQPYLTYNEPSARTYLVEGKPVLLDFYLTNIELSPDGYKVKMTIDGENERIFTSWQPYYIYGLKKGKHTLRLQLINRKNEQVDGSFNDVEQPFTVH